MAEEDALSSVYDLLILGTGQTESLVAAAAAKVGRKVLHVDSEAHYGGIYSSVSLKQLEELALSPLTASEETQCEIAAPPGSQQVARIVHAFRGGVCFHGATLNLPDELRKVAGRFSIDLVPSLVLSRGKAVDAILHSGASTYAEFKAVESAWVVDASSHGDDSSTWVFHKVWSFGN
jgi:Rab proteins geranylgeranyltransferase component A